MIETKQHLRDMDADLSEKARQIAPFHLDANGHVSIDGDNASVHVEIDKLMIETLKTLGLTSFAQYIEIASKDFWYE